MTIASVPFDPALAEILRHVPRSDQIPTLEQIPALREGGLPTPPLAQIIGARAIDYEDRLIPGPVGAPDLEITIIRPRNAAGALPCLYNIHGGGTIMGKRRDDHQRLVPMVEDLGAVTVNVEYRLAPE
ncbi:MAG: alpha/beta hydrolase fold domain-containing protein, partial [Leucobacter sp.]